MRKYIHSFFRMILLSCLAGWAGLSAATAQAKGYPKGDEEPETYWNFQQLKQAPAYREATFPESQYKGLQAVLYDCFRPNDEGAKDVFAYIGYPDTPMPEGGYPGVVLVHGGGGTAYGWAVDLWRSYGYAVIAMDWYNRRPIDTRGSKRLPLTGKEHRNHVLNVANIIRAHSLLRSLPKVNAEKTALVGLSWGSWYSSMATAVDPRFKCSVQIYCGHYTAGSTSFINGRFLHAAKVPMYWIVGTNDMNVTLDSLQAAFEHCPTTHNWTIIMRLPHSHVGFRFEACRRVVDSFLKGGTPLPRLAGGTLKDGVLTTSILHAGKGISHAKLCYATEHVNPWYKRTWKSIPATISGTTVSAKLPPKTYQAFITAFDDTKPYHYGGGSTNLFTIKD